MAKTNQKQLDFTGQDFYIGLDVHKKSWAVTIRSCKVEIGHFTQPPCVDTLAKYLQKKYPGGTYHSAYEAGFCGTGHHEALCKYGISNIIVHPGDVPTTDKIKKTKNDHGDSRSLAVNLEAGRLKGIYVPSRDLQELRSLYRLRRAKVQDVVRSINRLKGFLMFFGVEMPEKLMTKVMFSKRAVEWLNNLELSTEAGTFTLKQYIEELMYQRNQLFVATKELKQIVETRFSAEYTCLLSVPGIGPISSIAFLSEIGDFNRFKTPNDFTSYLGLMPWDISSGETSYSRGLHPRCNTYIRPILIEASWIAVKTSPRFLAYYRKHVMKNNKKAIIKIARKLALTCRGVVLKMQPYKEDYQVA